MTFVDAVLLARAQHAVDEVLPDGVSVEVLEGMLVLNPPPTFDHAVLTDRVGRELERRAPDDLTVNWAGMGVYEHDSPDAEYQVPDVVIFRGPRPGAFRYRIPWALVVDPATRSLSWYFNGTQHAAGPGWAGTLTAAALFR